MSERFADKTPEEVASQIVPKTFGTSRGDNKFNPAQLVFTFFIIFGVPAIYIWQVNNTVEASRKGYNDRATERAKARNPAYNVTALPTATSQGYMGADGTIYLTATLQPTPTTYPTLEPTRESKPMPTQETRVALAPVEVKMPKIVTPFQGEYWFMYSRYYPPLLGANCHPDNVIGETCKDTTSSGEAWSKWLYNSAPDGYRGGVAVPMIYPLGVVIEVSYPKTLAGKYLAVDYCPACDSYPGVLFLDFLDKDQNYEYWQPVKARFYYP